MADMIFLPRRCIFTEREQPGMPTCSVKTKPLIKHAMLFTAFVSAARDIGPVLFKYQTTVCRAGPIPKQHRFCLLV